ncbi:MAG: Na/Pi cotransporter family protein, partial [Minisyncoccia bacterium]
PFKNTPWFIETIKTISNPLIGILVGILFTLIVQASAIPIGILTILAGQGVANLESALPVVLGANIASTVDAILASFSANIHGKKVALAHVLIKISGVLLILPFFKFFISFLKFLTSDPPQQIVFSHIFFNLFIAIVFLILLKPFTQLIEKILKGKAEILPLWPEWLDNKYLNQPSLALEAVRKELKRMLIIARKIFLLSIDLIYFYTKSKKRDTEYIELVVDNLQREIAKFLDRISEAKLTEKEGGKLLHYAAIVDDIERIADQSTNIAKLARYKNNYRVTFSKEAEAEINGLKEVVNKSIDETLSLLEKFSLETVKNILNREEKIDQMVRHSKEKHFQRFFANICTAEAGPIFVDILINLERISDHCVNIAEYLTEIHEKYS